MTETTDRITVAEFRDVAQRAITTLEAVMEHVYPLDEDAPTVGLVVQRLREAVARADGQLPMPMEAGT